MTWLGIDWASMNKVQFSMSAVLTLLLVTGLVVLWAYTRSQHTRVDFKDLFCTNDEIDTRKFYMLGAWVVSTWGFVYLLIEERFSEWYFAGYMAAWVGNALVDKYISTNKEPKDDTDRPSAP